jgi:hypothetical protein
LVHLLIGHEGGVVGGPVGTLIGTFVAECRLVRPCFVVARPSALSLLVGRLLAKAAIRDSISTFVVDAFVGAFVAPLHS